ncbi:DUF805 domain-containing protein [Xanthomonas sacchari]|uniref:DUF805 domain-containing protein n=1 Tax=Xanthomonas sacchari TaxID=56458 RepID=UPI000581E7E4|nr:DUF805 domain-containing protein [Xanthomonas sacchari]AJC45523.1 hypothetical protein SB85_06840 [Xanthomonas sacchari]
MFMLSRILVLAVLFAMVHAGDRSGIELLWLAATCLMWLSLLAVLAPSLAAQVRRFHDQSRFGFHVVLGLIPYVGVVVVLVFMCLEGVEGRNRYGPDPKPR